MHKRYTTSAAFTIVELVIVIALVGLLFLLSVFAFGDWRKRTANAEANTALSHVAAATEDYLNFNNAYPSSLSLTGYKASDGITITYTSTSTTYCAQAHSTKVTTVIWFITHDNQVPRQGTCP